MIQMVHTMVEDKAFSFPKTIKGPAYMPLLIILGFYFGKLTFPKDAGRQSLHDPEGSTATTVSRAQTHKIRKQSQRIMLCFKN